MSKPLDLSRYDGHTPGPWDAKRLRDSDGAAYSTSYIAHIDIGPCMVWCPEGDREQESNARLIADAPALLAEVVRLRKECAVLWEFVRAWDAEVKSTEFDLPNAQSEYGNRWLDYINDCAAGADGLLGNVFATRARVGKLEAESGN